MPATTPARFHCFPGASAITHLAFFFSAVSICGFTGAATASDASSDGDPVPAVILETIPSGASEPAWLTDLLSTLEQAIAKYWAADFDAALSLLLECTAAMVEGRKIWPITNRLVETSHVYLVLTLDALGRDELAAEAASGLMALIPPPWATSLDLAPAAQETLDDLAAAISPVPTGKLMLSLPEPGCTALLDGIPAGEGSSVVLFPTAVPHWVSVSCPGGAPAHLLVAIEAGSASVLEICLPGETGDEEGYPQDGSPSAIGEVLSGNHPQDPGTPGDGKTGLLLATGPKPPASPWYGDGLNLALGISAAAICALGVGLVAGGLDLEAEAHRTASLRYAGLEKTSLDLEIAGWSLLGAGAVALIAAVIRTAIVRHHRLDGDAR